MAARFLSTMLCVGNEDVATSFCISNEGHVYSMGKNSFGAHGHDDKEPIDTPRRIPSLENIMAIAGSDNHSVCLDFKGNAFSFGRNKSHELGIRLNLGETLENSFIPIRIHLPTSIKAVSCGDKFSMCLSEDEFLYSFGNNKFGQLGHGDTEKNVYTSPKKIETLEDVEFVECGHDYTFCKTRNNVIYSWGKNNNGQLAHGHRKHRSKPFECQNYPDDVVDIKCGEHHILMLTLSQDVYSCGENYSGQLGYTYSEIPRTSELVKITSLSEIIRIECGYSHSMCIDIHNNFYIFGNNEYGQLGVGDTNDFETPTIHPILPNAIDISSKGDQTFVKVSPNEIYGFGSNEFSQLGIKTEEPLQLSPIQVFQDKENIWCSNQYKSKAKSARK